MSIINSVYFLISFFRSLFSLYLSSLNLPHVSSFHSVVDSFPSQVALDVTDHSGEVGLSAELLFTLLCNVGRLHEKFNVGKPPRARLLRLANSVIDSSVYRVQATVLLRDSTSVLIFIGYGSLVDV